MRIKNLNHKALKKAFKKYTLKRTFAGILAPVIITSMLSGCLNNDKRGNYSANNSYVNVNNSFDCNNDLTLEAGDNDYLDNNSNHQSNNDNNIIDNNISSDYLKIILNKNITFEYNFYTYAKEYISGTNVEYMHSKYFGVADALNKYVNLNQYISNNNLWSTTKKISSQELYEIVYNNNLNANFRESEKIDNNTLKEICKIISDLINNYSQNELIDWNLLFEKISNLKIKNYTEFSNGSYDPNKNLMCFSINHITTDKDFFKKTVQHETVHLMQAGSLNENTLNNVEFRFGPCYKFKNSNINPLYWNWFYEGTAETIMLNNNSFGGAEVYENQINIIDSVKLATVLSETKKIDDFENLSFSSDLGLLFKYFNCNTEKEKIEIINMMVAFDLILKTSSITNEFKNVYKLNTGESMYYEEQTNFLASLKGSAAQTLTKQFYLNFIELYKNKTVSINEVFSMISIFESNLSKITWYATTNQKEQLKDFIENYVNIQEVLFEYIESQTGIDRLVLYSAYNEFNKNYNFEMKNVYCLSDEKKEYYEKVGISRKLDKVDSIFFIADSQYNIKKVK